MDIEIEIATQAIDTRRGTSKNGKPYAMHSQDAYLHIPGKPYPERISVNIEENERGMPAPYINGRYSLAPESIRVGNYGRLEIRPILIRKAADTSKPVSTLNTANK